MSAGDESAGATPGHNSDPVLDAIVALVPEMLNALEALGFVARHLHPPVLDRVLAQLGEPERPLEAALTRFRAVAWPDELAQFRVALDEASAAALRSFAGLRAAVSAESGVVDAYRALRDYTAAVEALYPVAAMLPIVSRFYIEPAKRENVALLERLAEADLSREEVGVVHAGNDKRMRGGFSLYVPEYYDATQRWPLVVALHGGSGHGRLFLWSWLREARSRGLILLSPTALGGTWSLTEPELDSANVERMVEHVRGRWNIDDAHMLLTGMSDGGTFSLASGLRAASPFTHLAPVAAAFHPLLLEFADRERAAGLPIYLVHGALDWMFPAAMARGSRQALAAAGADVTYRELPDLSHAYPREENAAILDWFLGTRSG